MTDGGWKPRLLLVHFESIATFCLKPVSSFTLDSNSQFKYNLFQNGRNVSILLFTCKLVFVASFKGNYSFEFRV